MSEGLEKIQKELRRLQQEGVDRVFVGTSTLALLEPAKKQPDAAAAQPKTPSATRSEAGAEASGDLKALMRETEKPGAAKTPPPARAAPAPTGIKPLPDQPPQIDLPGGDKSSRMDWLRERVENCPVCREHLSERGKIVFGTGSVDADIFFCGEAPGAEEEIQGEPFVGKAGQLLTKIIQAMGLRREDVYIANILKWRPEQDKPVGNRPPTAEEMNFCLPYVKAQLEIVGPKVIVALGNTAVTGLLGPDPQRKMGSIRGKWHTFAGQPLMVTFHPSYLLRNGTLQTKRIVWEDLLQVMEKTGLPISEKQRGFFLPKS